MARFYYNSVRNFLGAEITVKEYFIQISQRKLIDRILDKFNMKDCKGMRTPMETNFQANTTDTVLTDVPYRELIGSLNYLAIISRPDIYFSVSYLGRFLDKPTNSVWRAAKRVLKYVSDTKHLCMTFRQNIEDENILAYSDSDWGSDCSDRKSVSGMAVYYRGNLVSWSSKKQQTVSLSSAESEYVAAAACAAELLYLRGLTEDFAGQKVKTVLNVDNQSAIAMINNYENTRRSKHIDIKAHFIRDIVLKGQIVIQYVSTGKNVADTFTKALCYDKFIMFRNLLNLV